MTTTTDKQMVGPKKGDIVISKEHYQLIHRQIRVTNQQINQIVKIFENNLNADVRISHWFCELSPILHCTYKVSKSNKPPKCIFCSTSIESNQR